MTQFLNTQRNNYNIKKFNQEQTNPGNQQFNKSNYGAQNFSNTMRTINNNETKFQKPFENFSNKNPNFTNNKNQNQNQNYSPWGQESNKNINNKTQSNSTAQFQNLNKSPFANENYINNNNNNSFNYNQSQNISIAPKSGKSIWDTSSSFSDKITPNVNRASNSAVINPVSIFTSSAFNLNIENQNFNSSSMMMNTNPLTPFGIQKTEKANKKLTGKDIFLSNKILNQDNSVFNAKSQSAIANETEMNIDNNAEAKLSNNAQADLLSLNFQFFTDSNTNRNLNANVNKNIFEKKSETVNKVFDPKNIFGALTTSSFVQPENQNIQDLDFEMEMDLDGNLSQVAKVNVGQIRNQANREINDSDKINNENKNVSQEVAAANKQEVKMLKKVVEEEKKLTFEEMFRKEYGLLSVLD